MDGHVAAGRDRAPIPGRTDLKQERAERTRAQILNSAAEAFASRGFPSVTIVDIAELTGMTKGAVYFHYANKESLGQRGRAHPSTSGCREIAETVHQGGRARWPRSPSS